MRTIIRSLGGAGGGVVPVFLSALPMINHWAKELLFKYCLPAVSCILF